MPDEGYATKLGKIWGNFHSLETVLRAILAQRDLREALTADQSFETLAAGDLVRETPLTDYASLGQIIKQFNTVVSADRRIDPTLVELRDALAHGRVWSSNGSFPLRLLKFDRPKDGSVRVTWATTLTDEWLDQQRERVFNALVRAHSAEQGSA
jgi:hypothetical protein